MKTRSTVYVTAKALETVSSLNGLDEGERDILASNPETDIRYREGYSLNFESMPLAVLPHGSDIAVVLTPCDSDRYRRHVSFPPELRGVVFSGAPRLPEGYADTLTYWSPMAITADGAQHCQNLLNEYPVPEIDGRPQDALLSNAVVICIKQVGELTAGLETDQFIEIAVPVVADMLGMDREQFDSDRPYSTSPSHPVQRIFLQVSDILASPNPDFIAIAVFHTENWDADYYL